MLAYCTKVYNIPLWSKEVRSSTGKLRTMMQTRKDRNGDAKCCCLIQSRRVSPEGIFEVTQFVLFVLFGLGVVCLFCLYRAVGFAFWLMVCYLLSALLAVAVPMLRAGWYALDA